MTRPFSKSWRFYKVAPLLSSLVAKLGASALPGWAFDISALKRIVPAPVTMKSHTAVGLPLLGRAPTFLSRNRST
jgi:hypothetical protein